MKEIRIEIVNNEKAFSSTVNSEGFDKSLEADVQRGNMAIQAYAMGLAGVVASIPLEDRLPFLAAFAKQVLSYANNPNIKATGVKSVRYLAGQN